MCLAAAAGFFGPKSDGRVYELVLGSQSTDAKVSVDCVGGIDDELMFFAQIIDKLKKTQQITLIFPFFLHYLCLCVDHTTRYPSYPLPN